MMLLVRAVVTGFGLSLGSAIFKEVRERLGWPEEDDKKAKDDREVQQQDGATDPGLRS